MSPATQSALMMGAILFCVGMVGFLTRRSLILMFLSLELMLAGVSVNFIAFSQQHENYQGQVFAIFILAVAACEAAIALSLIVALHRDKPTLDVGQWRELGETAPDLPGDPLSEAVDGQPLTFPKLTPAGLDPMIRPLARVAPDGPRNSDGSLSSERRETPTHV